MDESVKHLEIVDKLINQIHNQQPNMVVNREQNPGENRHRSHKVGLNDVEEKQGNSHQTYQSSGYKKLSPGIQIMNVLDPELSFNFDYPPLPQPNLKTTAITYSAKANLNVLKHEDFEENSRKVQKIISPPSNFPPATLRCNKCQYHFVEGQFVLKGENLHHHNQHLNKKTSSGDQIAFSLDVPLDENKVNANYNGLLSSPVPNFTGHPSNDYYCSQPRGGLRNRSFYNRNKMLHSSMKHSEIQSRSNYWRTKPFLSNMRKTHSSTLQSPILSTPQFEFPDIDADRLEAMQRCVIDEEISRKDKAKNYGPLADVIVENGVLQIVSLSDEEEVAEGKEKEINEKSDNDNEENVEISTEGKEELNPKVLELFKHFESIEANIQQYPSLIPQPQKTLKLSSLSTFIKKVAATNQPRSASVESPSSSRGQDDRISLHFAHQPMTSTASLCISSGGCLVRPPTRRLSRKMSKFPPITYAEPTTSTNLTLPLSPSSIHHLRSLAKTFKTIEIGDQKMHSKQLDLGSIDFESLGFVDFDGRNVTLYKYIAYVNQHQKRFIQPSLELLKM